MYSHLYTILKIMDQYSITPFNNMEVENKIIQFKKSPTPLIYMSFVSYFAPTERKMFETKMITTRCLPVKLYPSSLDSSLDCGMT